MKNECKNSLLSEDVPKNAVRFSLSNTVKPLKETNWRWAALILMNLLVFGDFVSIDNPQPLQTQIEQILGLDDQQYSLLYSIWAFPSIIIPFFGGYLIDKLGVRPALFIFSLALTVGQAIYAYGGYALNFTLMLVGRGIYAIGSDPLNVAQIVITNKWFQGNEVGFAMALGTTSCGIGRALNSYLVPKLYQIYGTLFAPMLFAALVCLVALISALLMIVLDKINDKQEERIALIASQELRNSGASGASDENISLKDIRYFKAIVWLLITNFALTNGLYFSFNAFSNDLYYQEYNFTNTAAGTIISISFIVTSISSTIMGKVVDLHGYRATMILYNSLLGVAAFVYFLVVPDCNQCLTSIIPQVCFGLLIGVNDAATFPSLPLILEEKYLGTGYGLFFVLQNILMLILPPISAAIKDNTESATSDGFFWMFVFFGAGMVLTFFESILLLIQDRKSDRILDKTVITDEEEESSSPSSIRDLRDSEMTPARSQIESLSAMKHATDSSTKSSVLPGNLNP